MSPPEGMTEAILALADGTLFRGTAFGATGETFGEVVFNTSLTGYQEVLTDPSYHGQIVAMTYPHQGNYGCNRLDEEALHPWVRGFVVREWTPRPSSWRAEEGLHPYLVRHGVVGIAGIDTRRLTRRLRTEGAMQGGVSTLEGDPRSFVERVRAAPGIIGVDLVREVTPPSAYDVDPEELLVGAELLASGTEMDGVRVAAVDYGMKRHILRCLVARGATVRVFPADSTAEDIVAWGPDGVFLSNGPGDPAALGYAHDTIGDVLRRRIPTFGICLGHQLLGTALGGSTYKLKFGHRGVNHPVKSMVSGRVEITTHNHGFAVKTGASPPQERTWLSSFGDVELTHFDLNDGTLEGMRCRDVPAFSVQYHPEAAPGPHDARYLFDSFAELVISGR